MGKALVKGDKVVVNGDLVMGKALGATFDFALKLVNILAGKEAEHNIRKAICYDMIEALDYNWN